MNPKGKRRMEPERIYNRFFQNLESCLFSEQEQPRQKKLWLQENTERECL